MTKTETGGQNDIRLEASRLNNWLWRNNNGACETKQGRQIRYGLANDSKEISRTFKSSDLIGITPRVITQADVGKVLGVFTAIEAKKPGWKWGGTERERGQLNFMKTVITSGGLAGFAQSVEDYINIVKVKV